MSASTPSPELIDAEQRAAAFGKVLMDRDALTAYCRLRDTASAFIAYYSRGGGCSNCGGLPHTDTCFVARFSDAAGWPVSVREHPPAPQGGEPGAGSEPLQAHEYTKWLAAQRRTPAPCPYCAGVGCTCDHAWGDSCRCGSVNPAPPRVETPAPQPCEHFWQPHKAGWQVASDVAKKAVADMGRERVARKAAEAERDALAARCRELEQRREAERRDAQTPDVEGLPEQSYIAVQVDPLGPGMSVYIERRPQREGPDLWAVKRGSCVLSKDGEWEWEPIPSSRTDEFLTRCRFASPAEAFSALTRLTGGPQR